MITLYSSYSPLLTLTSLQSLISRIDLLSFVTCSCTTLMTIITRSSLSKMLRQKMMIGWLLHDPFRVDGLPFDGLP
jgi:hypothetical protein